MNTKKAKELSKPRERRVTKQKRGLEEKRTDKERDDDVRLKAG